MYLDGDENKFLIIHGLRLKIISVFWRNLNFTNFSETLDQRYLFLCFGRYTTLKMKYL